MIYFCEDCGQKNLLNSTQIQNERAVFKCDSCGFQNDYSIRETQNAGYRQNKDSKQFLDFSKITGIDQYIFVGQQGNIKDHNIKNPNKTAIAVLSCAKKSFDPDAAGVSHVVFPQKDKKHFFIFPIGSSYLGLIKKADISSQILKNNIIKLIKKHQ